MVIGHWTHLATLVLVSPCRLGPNCFGPLFLQLCLSFGNRQPCLFGRIERPNASLLPPARTRRHVVDAPLELAAARLGHTARKAAAASLLLGRRSISGRACSSGGSHARGRRWPRIASLAIELSSFVAGSRLTGKKLDKSASGSPC